MLCNCDSYQGKSSPKTFPMSQAEVYTGGRVNKLFMFTGQKYTPSMSCTIEWYIMSQVNASSINYYQLQQTTEHPIRGKMCCEAIDNIASGYASYNHLPDHQMVVFILLWLLSHLLAHVMLIHAVHCKIGLPHNDISEACKVDS